MENHGAEREGGRMPREMAAGKHISPASSLKSDRKRTEEKLEHISARRMHSLSRHSRGRIRVFFPPPSTLSSFLLHLTLPVYIGSRLLPFKHPEKRTVRLSLSLSLFDTVFSSPLYLIFFPSFVVPSREKERALHRL